MRCALASVLLLLAACGAPAVDTSSNVQPALTPPFDPIDEDPEVEFAKIDTEPRLLNGSEIWGLHDSTLKAGGVDGSLFLWILIDDSGTVTKTRVFVSSGTPALDQAAQEIAEAMRFSPAEYKGSPVSVWIAQPMLFWPNEHRIKGFGEEMDP